MNDRKPLTSFVGNLTRDPVVKTTPRGDNIVEFGIAVSDGFGDDANTEFKNVAVWNEGLCDSIMQGENGRPVIYKGSPVAVQGTVKPRGGYNDDVNAVRVGTIVWLQRSKNGESRPAPQAAAPAADESLDF